MPQVILSSAAVADVKRLREFLLHKYPRAAKTAAETIIKMIQSLEKFPEMGKPMTDASGFRELFIEYGNYGYMAKYRYNGNLVVIVNIRAGRQNNYRDEPL